MRRPEAGTERPSSWWLSLLLGDHTLAADYVKSHSAKVKDIITLDVKTASLVTPFMQLPTCSKRVPILNKGGDLVGIVRRANIIQEIARGA